MVEVCSWLRRFVLLALVGLQCTRAQTNNNTVEECFDEAYIRPVVLVPGFVSSFLYNSSNSYSLEYPDPADLVGDGPSGDLALPLDWSNLEQAQSAIGPEESATDTEPDLFTARGVFYLEPFFSNLRDIVTEWEDPANARRAKLFYTVAWDWRRDPWEQGERVQQVIQTAFEQTACRPLVVAHSYGGRAAHAAFARFGAPLMDRVHAVIYAGVPFVPNTAFALLASGNENGISGGLLSAETLFTLTSPYLFVPRPQDTCVNAPSGAGGQPAPCPVDKVQTGVSCSNTLCGRPADWPAREPFFVGSLNLQNPSTWEDMPIGLPLRRALTGGSPVLTMAETEHLGNATQASARMAAYLYDADKTAALIAAHPPAAVVVDALTEVQNDVTQEQESFLMPSYLVCEGSEAFGNNDTAAAQCANVTGGGFGPSDGTILAFQTTPPGDWGAKLRVFNFTTPSTAYFLAETAELGFSPHSLMLQRRATLPGTVLDCSSWPGDADSASGASLETMLCSMLTAPREVVAGAQSPAAPASSAAAPRGLVSLVPGLMAALSLLVSGCM